MVLPRDRSGLLSPRLAFPDAAQVGVLKSQSHLQLQGTNTSKQCRATALLHLGSGAGSLSPAGHSSGPLHTNTVAKAVRGVTLQRPVAVPLPEQAEGSGSSVRLCSLW